ncbi:MAG TPA: hypothetical protein PK297_07255, partial [Spirochaetota bacterium]|nr:hypothetical protein [Spirochaetota bacterium]
MDRFDRTCILPDCDRLPRKELSGPEQPDPRCLGPGNQGVPLVKYKTSFEHHALDGQGLLQTLRFEIAATDAGDEVRSLC